MGGRQHTVPMIVSEGRARALVPVPTNELFQPESWLQELLFANPSLIPIEEIEPGFQDLIPAAQELRTASKRLDILFFDRDGHLILVETKLWKNPEARREVVGQILEYAAIMSAWSYTELVHAVKNAKGLKASNPDPLVAMARESAGGDFNETRFVDAVSQNLARGRFLLIIAGDGIHEGLEQMADFLQRSPQLSFRLALVEIAVFRLENDSKDVLIVPRIIARTHEITRAVIEVSGNVKPSDIVVTVPETDLQPSAASGNVRNSLTEEEYFTELEQNTSKETVELVRTLVADTAGHSFGIEYARSGSPIIKYRDDETDQFFTFGTLANNGILADTDRLSRRCVELGLPADIWRNYLDSLAGLIPGTARQPLKTRPDIEGLVYRGKRETPYDALIRNRELWFQLIDKTIDELREALAAQK